MQKCREPTTKSRWPSGLARRPALREFLSSKPDGAKFLKKNQMQEKRVESRGIMDLCSKLFTVTEIVRSPLKNKGISSLYAMKRCSAGEGTNAFSPLPKFPQNVSPTHFPVGM